MFELLTDKGLDEVLSICADIQKQCEDIQKQCKAWRDSFDVFTEEIKQ